MSGSFWKLNKATGTNGIATFEDYNRVYCPDGSSESYTSSNKCITYQLATYYLNVSGSYSNNQLVKYSSLSRRKEETELLVNHTVNGDTSMGSTNWYITCDIYSKVSVAITVKVGAIFNVVIPANSYGSDQIDGGYYLPYDPEIPLYATPESVDEGYLRPGYDKVYNISMARNTLE